MDVRPGSSTVRDATPTPTTTDSLPHLPASHPHSATSSTTTNTSSTFVAPPAAQPPTYPPPQHVSASIMDVDSNTTGDDRSRRATSVLSMDDLEAAQALEGLRSEYGQSPRASSQRTSTSNHSGDSNPRPEPLLSLLTSTHPLISSAIHNSVSAYTTSKSYSPRFKSGAEFIERNIGSPVASTVGTVGRKTGVESGIRWALQRRASNSDPKRSKRRKVTGQPTPDMDVEKGLEESELPHRARSASDLSMTEPLPPYDEFKSPSYHEIDRENSSRQNAGWQSRLVISTSGLGVAMSEESLRSLQYCLTWLRWANGRLGKSILALQQALKEWDQAKQQHGDSQNTSLLFKRIQAVKADVLSTLKQVVDVVSKYAGGALPDNARNLVRRHLTSLPHRFQVASTSNPPPDSPAAASDATIGAHRILVLAQEGLDMMAQVSGVVNDTLVSAEHWCERLGKKRPEKSQPGDPAAAAPSQTGDENGSFPADVKPPVPEQTQDIAMTGTEKV